MPAPPPIIPPAAPAAPVARFWRSYVMLAPLSNIPNFKHTPAAAFARKTEVPDLENVGVTDLVTAAAAASVVYRARPSLPARVVPRSIILSACGAEGREGLADVISIHSRLTNQILLSRTGKQLVHNFERARSTPGSTSVALWAWLERMERDGSLLTSAVEYGLSKRV